MIVTNLSQFYSSPECKAPLGSSDHSIVFWQPNRACISKATRSINANKFPLRRMPESALCAFGRWVSAQDWADVFSHTSISECVLAFTAEVNSTVLFFPLKMVRSHPNDKPWMTPHIKDLIL